MKRVVLLGDSIREIGYGARVTEMLKDEYTVHQAPENCRFAKYTLRCLYDWKELLSGADCIHWNNGLWDVCDLFGDGPFTSVDEYVENMVRIAKILKSYAPTVIFATTTPAHPKMWGHDMERTNHYNKAVTKALEKENIIINDLYTPVASDIDEMICEDNIHLSQKGIEITARAVADCIRRQIG